MVAMSRDPPLGELLDDLRHDLAKYLRLPLRLLPRDADPDLVREAVERALLRTQQSTSGTRSAREIYAAHRAALAGASADPTRLRALDAAVNQALRWELVLVSGAPLDRARIDQDFDALARIIDAWFYEVQRG